MKNYDEHCKKLIGSALMWFNENVVSDMLPFGLVPYLNDTIW